MGIPRLWTYPQKLQWYTVYTIGRSVIDICDDLDRLGLSFEVPPELFGVYPIADHWSG